MSGIHRNVHNTEKPIPGCLGRMVNLFDLSTGVSGKKLLTDKPHCDGYTLSRSHSDVAKKLRRGFGDEIRSKLHQNFSNGKANGTPMKMLIDQEMLKETESKNNSPNVVAKLMGLDTLPLEQHGAAAHRSHRRGYSQGTIQDSGMPLGCWEQEDGFLKSGMQCEVDCCPEQKEYKGVCEVWKQPIRTNYGRDKSPQKGKYNEKINEKKMALVRQKFIEAKCLATDGKLRQSKEFQDALEVLSSNKDLFVKFLQESNSLLSPHVHGFQSIPSSPEKTCITVLAPLKMINNEKYCRSKSEKQMNKPVKAGQSAFLDKNDQRYSPTLLANQKADEHVHPTRIVVLKPSSGKNQVVKAVISPPCSSPRTVGQSFNGEPEYDEEQESGELAREITQRMHENLVEQLGDENLLSSVFSNSYIGDESSFNKSENYCAVENLSDLEVLSPSSRHSWDYMNRFGSPYSSSFSRVSCSPESSVCREAKKRLSERWAMVASNGNIQEQGYVKRSSCTLGEMLALSETKKLVIRSDDEVSDKEQEPKESIPCRGSVSNNECVTDSPKSLLRSKSAPVSSTAFGARLNCESETGKGDVSNEVAKAKSLKSSFKGKLSSLLFPRNHKLSREKYNLSQSKDEPNSEATDATVLSVHVPGRINEDASHAYDGGFEDCSTPALSGLSGPSPDLISLGVKQGIVSCEEGLPFTKSITPVNVSENQNQPSPISVFEPPFYDDDSATQELCGYMKPDCHGSHIPLKCNLIDKSPHIESIARTLSWEDSCSETAPPYSLKSSPICRKTEEKEQDWFLLVHKLLTESNLDGEINLLFSRLYTLENPLDPSLRDTYANSSHINDKEPMHEAKRRQLRSTRKLVYDSVNEALLDISCYYRADMSGAHEGRSEILLVDHVWDRIKGWFCSDVRCVLGENGDSNSLVVERVVRKEVGGKGWIEHLRMERDNMGKELERKLLEELVDEILADLTGRP